jgi:hypothetical protein
MLKLIAALVATVFLTTACLPFAPPPHGPKHPRHHYHGDYRR